MRIQDLIEYCKARITVLSQLRTSAERLGDVAQIEKIDIEIATTQDTLNQLMAI